MRSAAEEWRSGWPVVIASAMGIYLSVTHTYTLGLFIQPIERETGWGRETITSGALIVAVIAFFVVPAVGSLLDRLSVRRVALPGVAAYCLCLAALGFAGPGVVSWMLTWVALGIAYCFISTPIWTAAPVSRFDRSRGMALAVTLLGTAVCALTLPMAVNALIDHLGWRHAFMALAGTLFLIVFPVILFGLHDARSRPASPGSEAAAGPVDRPEGLTIHQAIRSLSFWKMSIAAFLAVVGLLGLTVHFVPILTGHGLNRTAAAGFASAVGVGGILGRLITGWCLDRFSGALVAAIAFALPVTACLLLLFGQVPIAFLAAAVLLGFSLGAEVDVMAYITGRYFGLRNYGALFGFVAGCLTLGAGIGPFLAGFIYDHTGGYGAFLTVQIFTFLVAAALVGSLGRYPEWSPPIVSEIP